MYKTIVGVLFVCGALVWAQGGDGGAAAKKGPMVLVVDLQKVVDECDEARALVGRLEKKAADERKRLQALADKLNLKATELRKSSNMSNRDPKFYEDQKKLALEAARLKVEQQLVKEKAGDDIVRKIEALWKDARMKARSIMNKRGAQIVLTSKMGPLVFENQKQLQDEFIVRRVLCIAAREADITQDVLQAMNADYKNRKKPGKDGEVVKISNTVKTPGSGKDKPKKD